MKVLAAALVVLALVLGGAAIFGLKRPTPYPFRDRAHAKMTLIGAGMALILAVVLFKVAPTLETPAAEGTNGTASPAQVTSADTAEAGTSRSSADDFEEKAAITARMEKKMAGLCQTDAECEALITDADLTRARNTLSEVLGKSSAGDRSARAPSRYFDKLAAWHCDEGKDVCARKWFATYKATMFEAVSKGDDSDDVPIVPGDDQAADRLTPYRRGELLEAGVPFDALENIWSCRQAIIMRRWFRNGDKDTTRSDVKEALDTCFRKVSAG